MLFALFTSCSRDKSKDKILAKHLKKLQEINPIIESSGWEIVQTFDGQSKTVYQLTRSFDNGSERMIFYFYKDSSSYLLDTYRKQYDIDSNRYILEMDTDTLFFYKTKKLDNSDNYFFTGKYNFLFKFGKLNAGQLGYYLLHKDSLSRVRGNNLKPLPEILEDSASHLVF